MLTAPLPAAPEAAASQLIDVLAIDAQPLTVRRRPRLAIHGRRLNVLYGHVATVSGTLRPRLARVQVVLDGLFGRRWIPVAHATTGARGRFQLRYAPRRTGSWDVQVHVRGDAWLQSATARIGRLVSYQPAIASWYGGGGETACGSYLTSATMGVANRTLPCGTPVTLRYDGRTVTVDVIDRGPYVEGREFDLTEATKRALDFEGVGEVWATR